MLRKWPFGAENGIPILMYHRLGRPPAGTKVAGHFVSPGLFAAHLRALARLGYQSVSLDQVAHYLASGEMAVLRPLVITFDDGYQCLHRYALPALKQHGFTATVFMVAGHVGGDNAWEQRIGDPPQPLLTREQMLEMQAGGISFASHTCGHAHLDQMNPPQVRQELVRSRELLEEITGQPVRHLAYPYGAYDQQVAALAAEAGYRTACTTRRGVALPGRDPLRLPRINVRRYNLTWRLLAKIRHAYRLGWERRP